MFSPQIESIIPDWKAKKDIQWAAVKGTIPGLQLVVSGPSGTQYTIVCAPHDGSFYEAVTFGQLPQIVLEEYGSRLNRRVRDIPDAKKPLGMRAIDLSDVQLDAVVRKWSDAKSALTLSFVSFVIDATGKLKGKP